MMDDFLHNLRSGKLKQPDRSSRPYDQNYKNAQRRNMMDRRKRDFGNKESTEKLDAIKEVLENLSEWQRRMAEAYEARTRAEERKARAMEVLAKNLYRMLNPEAKDADALFSVTESVPAAIEQQQLPLESEPVQEAQDRSEPKRFEDAEPENNSSYLQQAEVDEQNIFNAADQTDRLTEDKRQDLLKIIAQLRQEGNNWERIARVVADRGYPTISGRGSWRGVMVKNLYEKMETE